MPRFHRRGDCARRIPYVGYSRPACNGAGLEIAQDQRRLAGTVDAQVAARHGRVVLDGRHADLEFARDFLFLHVPRDHAQHLLLTFRQKIYAVKVAVPVFLAGLVVHYIPLTPRRT